ncbi:hypothetical protein N8810_02035 [Flavobacteriaceae bacterium]|nr:hypothetical protein [Flavobacteriaceae bacterium]
MELGIYILVAIALYITLNLFLKKNIYGLNVSLTLFVMFGGLLFLFNIARSWGEHQFGFGSLFLFFLIWVVFGGWMFLATFFYYDRTASAKGTFNNYMLLNKKCPNCMKKLPSYFSSKCPYCTADTGL